MARASMLYFVLALAIAGVMFFSGDGMSAADDCQSDIMGLIANCMDFIQKNGPPVPPSEQCCGVIQNAARPCVCKYLTSDIEKLIDMSKVVFVTEKCGRTLAHGSKCGNYEVPMA